MKTSATVAVALFAGAVGLAMGVSIVGAPSKNAADDEVQLHGAPTSIATTCFGGVKYVNINGAGFTAEVDGETLSYINCDDAEAE